MLWELLHWFVDLVEVIAVVVIVLGVGLSIAIAAFWVLSRSLSKLAGAPEPDPDEYEMHDNPADDGSAPAERDLSISKHLATRQDLCGKGPLG
jgi:hypothetical protein